MNAGNPTARGLPKSAWITDLTADELAQAGITRETAAMIWLLERREVRRITKALQTDPDLRAKVARLARKHVV